MTHRHEKVPAIVCGLPATYCPYCDRMDGLGGVLADLIFDAVIIVDHPHWLRGFASWFFSPMEHWSSYWQGQGSCVLASFFLLRAGWLALSLAGIVEVLRAAGI